MSSNISSGSRDPFEQDAMLDLDDPLDYEPSLVDYHDESDSREDDLVHTKRDYNKYEKYVQQFEERIQEYKRNREFSPDKDSNSDIEFPEPSGQKDQESSNHSSSGKQSFSNGTDSENVLSVTNYREKMNYIDLHVDVEKNSFRSKFGTHSLISELTRLDSSSEEEEEDGQVDGEFKNNIEQEGDSREDSYEPEEALSDKSSVSSDQNSEESDGVESQQSYQEGNEQNEKNQNLVHQPLISNATTTKLNNSVHPSLDHVSKENINDCNYTQKNNTINNNIGVLQPNKQTPLNFSIQVVGGNRIFSFSNPPQLKMKHYKPWDSMVRKYLADDIFKLTSKDEVIKYTPIVTDEFDIRSKLDSSIAPSSVKSRLGESSLSGHTSESGSSSSVFKVPLKRPPTRPKATTKNLSVSVDVKSNQLTVTPVQTSAPTSRITRNDLDDNQDDIISLSFSTCQLSVGEEREENLDRSGSNTLIPKNGLFSRIGSSHGTEQAKRERTQQWVTKTTEPKIPKQVPSIFNGLCFNQFFFNRCNAQLCRRSHFLVGSSTQIKQLPHLSPDKLEEAYNFAKELPYFYGQIYKHFANVFALKDMKQELVNMVHIIFEESSHEIKQEEGLDTVLNALQKTNLNIFEDTVEYLLLQIGLPRYPSLGNVLLEIICKKPDLVQHWPIIRRLIIAGEKMTDKLGTKFLIHLMKSPVNTKICQEVYHHILSSKFIDLPRVTSEIREPFLKICSQENVIRDAELQQTIERNLTKERFNFERSTQNNQLQSQNSSSSPNLQLMGFDFSVPPPIHFGRFQIPTSCNYIPPTQFGSNLGPECDFSSLSQQNKTSSTDTNHFDFRSPSFENNSRSYNNRDRRGVDNSSQSSDSRSNHDQDIDFRYRPSRRGNRCNINESSVGANEQAQFSDSDSQTSQNSSLDLQPLFSPLTRKRTAPTGLMYNKEGLQYDPRADYVPPPKKQHFNVGEFQERSVINKNSSQFDHDRSQATGLNVQDLDIGRFEPPLPECERLSEWYQRGNPSQERPNQATLDSNEPPGSEFNRLKQNEGPSNWHQNFRRTIVIDRNRREAELPFDILRYSEEERRLPYERPNLANESDYRAGPSAQSVSSTNRIIDTGARRLQFNVRNNEAAVSSSSDAKLTHLKPPESPQFGKLYFDPNYEFGVSLHNLYLEAIDNVDIDGDDIHKLNNCVRIADGTTFLEFIEKYKGPKTVQNFISMTLAHLRGMNQFVAVTYQGLLDTIERKNPRFYGNRYIRVILEVITMNLLFDLEQRGMLKEANKFLNKFSDWDSLVTSRLFIKDKNRKFSIIRRYLFIANILTACKPELTYEILVDPTLHLLEKYENWPYHPPCPIPEICHADLEYRNSVIANFLKTGYQLNTVSVIQLYKRRKIWDFGGFLDIQRYIDPMIIYMINERLIISLKQITNEINLFWRHMSKDVLRAFLITVYKHLTERDQFRLYEKCVEKRIYQRLVREQNIQYTIEIKTNMHRCELKLILKYYLTKLKEIRKVPPESEPLRFEIKPPGEMSLTSLPILNKYQSVLATRDLLIHLLQEECSLVVSQNSFANIIEVEKEELVRFLERVWT